MVSSLGHYCTGVAHDNKQSGKGHSPGTTSQIELPVPPTLLPSQGSRAEFQIRNGNKEQLNVIKLSTTFPLKNGQQGNNMA